MNYHLPETALSPIDLINRRAAATGSMTYARLASDADYNGHPISVSYKPHAVSGAIWNAEYYRGGRVVIGRGSLAHCLEAAKAEHDRGAGGCSVRVYLHEEAPEPIEHQRALCSESGFVAGKLPETPAWWSGRHAAVSDSFHWDKRFPHHQLLQHALQYEGTVEAWQAERSRYLEEQRS